MSAPGGVSVWSLVPGGCLLQGVGGGLPGPGGVCLVPGGGIPACTEADPPPVNRMNDRHV